VSDELDVNIDLIVAANWSVGKVALKKWATEHKISGSEDEEFAAMCAWDGHGNLLVLLLKNCLNVRCIVHESFHCIHRVWEYLGDEFDKDHHEPYSTIIGWLAEKIIHELRHAKLKIS
jgi:hypothetical protein